MQFPNKRCFFIYTGTNALNKGFNWRFLRSFSNVENSFILFYYYFIAVVIFNRFHPSPWDLISCLL